MKTTRVGHSHAASQAYDVLVSEVERKVVFIKQHLVAKLNKNSLYFNMLGQTLKRLGCCGVLVWLTIAAVFSTFFIMEYLERPASEKSFWKAGVTVSIS